MQWNTAFHSARRARNDEDSARYKIYIVPHENLLAETAELSQLPSATAQSLGT